MSGEQLLEMRVKDVTDRVMVIWFEWTNGTSVETFLECGTYIDHKLVATVKFDYGVTLEEINRFLETSSEQQKIPGYHRCPKYKVVP